MSTIETVTQTTLTLRTENDLRAEETYKYAHLLPHFSQVNYPPLIPFEHVDPGFHALKHSNPRAFLKGATSIIELTPNLGAEIRGIRLTDLDSDGRDQLALEVSTAASP
jgi:sulfonate dioxygenase